MEFVYNCQDDTLSIIRQRRTRWEWFQSPKINITWHITLVTVFGFVTRSFGSTVRQKVDSPHNEIKEDKIRLILKSDNQHNTKVLNVTGLSLVKT